VVVLQGLSSCLAVWLASLAVGEGEAARDPPVPGRLSRSNCTP